MQSALPVLSGVPFPASASFSSSLKSSAERCVSSRVSVSLRPYEGYAHDACSLPLPPWGATLITGKFRGCWGHIFQSVCAAIMSLVGWKISYEYNPTTQIYVINGYGPACFIFIVICGAVGFPSAAVHARSIMRWFTSANRRWALRPRPLPTPPIASPVDDKKWRFEQVAVAIKLKQLKIRGSLESWMSNNSRGDRCELLTLNKQRKTARRTALSRYHQRVSRLFSTRNNY